MKPLSLEISAVSRPYRDVVKSISRALAIPSFSLMARLEG